MNRSISTAQASELGLNSQPVKAFLGLKRHQWSRRTTYKTITRDCLEGLGANVIKVECYLKNGGKSYTPRVDPNVINLFIQLKNQNAIDIVA